MDARHILRFRPAGGQCLTARRYIKSLDLDFEVIGEADHIVVRSTQQRAKNLAFMLAKFEHVELFGKNLEVLLCGVHALMTAYGQFITGLRQERARERIGEPSDVAEIRGEDHDGI